MILVLVGVAWMIATNRCAIAAIAGSHSPRHSCCKEAPARSEKTCAEKCCGETCVARSRGFLAASPVWSFLITLPPQVVSVPSVAMLLQPSGLAPPDGVVPFYVRFLVGSTSQPTAPAAP
jgi:hypothetical protein